MVGLVGLLMIVCGLHIMVLRTNYVNYKSNIIVYL